MLAFHLGKTSVQLVHSQQDAKKVRKAEARSGLWEEEEIKLLATPELLEQVDLKFLEKETSVYCLLRLRSQKQVSFVHISCK